MSATECGSFSLADFTLKQTTFEPFHEDTQFNASDENPLVAYKVRVNFEGNLPLPESECKWTHVGFCYDRPYVEWIHGSFTGNFNADGAPIVTVEWAAAGPLSSTVYDLWRNGKYEIYDISGNSITFAIGGHPDSIDVTHEFGVRAVNLLDGCLSDLVTCTVTVPGDLTECPPEAGDILIKTNIVGPVYDGNGDLTGIKIQIVWSGETGSYIKILRSFEGCGGEFEERDSVSVTENYYYDILQSGQIATYKVVSGRNNCDLVGESDCYTINVTPMTGLNEGTVYFYVKDHLGNTRLVLDRDGYIQSRMDYEPYGIELYPLAANSSREKYKFTNQERDYTTGLDYMHARYYSSALGRFMGADGIVGTPEYPQSWNLYSYVRGNPIGLNDPKGQIDPAMADWNRSVSKKEIEAFQKASAKAKPAPGTKMEQALLITPVAAVGVLEGMALFALGGPTLLGLSSSTVTNVLAGAGIGTVSGGAQSIQQGEDPSLGMLLGATAGGATGNVPANALFQSGLAGASANAATQFVTSGKVDPAPVVTAGISGASTGAVTTLVETVSGQAASPFLSPAIQGGIDILQTGIVQTINKETDPNPKTVDK